MQHKILSVSSVKLQFVLVTISYLSEQCALWFQVKAHAMPLVIQKVFQAQELHSTQSSPISPIHTDLQLPRLQKQKHLHEHFTFCFFWLQHSILDIHADSC